MNLSEHKVDIIAEFLEIAFHNIVHCTNIYPEGIFEQRKKYDVPVFISVYPGLHEYISDSIRMFLLISKHETPKKICIVFLDGSQQIFRYVFKTFYSDDYEDCNSSLFKLEGLFKTFILKLNTTANKFIKLSDTCTFKIFFYCTEQVALKVADNTSLQAPSYIQVDDITNFPNSAIIPLFETPELGLEVYVETYCSEH